MSFVRTVVPALLLASSASANQIPASPPDGRFQRFPAPLEVGPFTLTERSGNTVTRDDLTGKVWIVQFFYCTCEQGCAKNTASMSRLQQALADCPDAHLLSIHVFPEEEDLELLR